jgi:Kef-type K+ transport system membrane component KefB
MSNPADLLRLLLALAVIVVTVLPRIVSEQGLVGRPIGGLALASAALDDVLAWSLVAAAVGLLLCSELTSWRIFGAFLFGVVMPRAEVAGLYTRVLPQIEQISSIMLLAAGVHGAGNHGDDRRAAASDLPSPELVRQDIAERETAETVKA